MASPPIDPSMPAGEVLRRYPRTLEVFDRHGVVFCAGCFLTLFDPLEEVAGYHAVHDVQALIADLNQSAEAPAGPRPAWAEGSAPPLTALGKPLTAREEGEVAARMTTDALATGLGVRLLGARRGSARAGLKVETAPCHPALLSALVLFVAHAAHATVSEASPALLDLGLAPLDLDKAGGFLVAEAYREGAVAQSRTSAYRVRVLGRADSIVAVATVLLGASA